MKRSKRLMLLALALVILAGASFAALKLNPDTDAADSAGEEAVSIYTVDPESVTKLSWTYNGETVTLMDAGDGWMYADDRNFPLDESYLDDMLDALSEITSSKTIENVEDLAQYGLEEPACAITVTAGKTSEIKLGDTTSLGGQRYLSLGDGNVYLVDSSLLDDFSYGLYDIIRKESIPSMSTIRSFVVDDGDRQFTIDYLEESGLAHSDQYTWFAETEDGYCTLDTELARDFVEQVTDLKWGKCVDYKATASALKEYGLDDPAVTVTVTYVETSQVETNMTDDDGKTIYDTKETEQTFVLEIGGYNGNYCYARLAGSQMVYLISADICDCLLYTDENDLLPDDVLVMDWDTVTGIDITVDDCTYSVVKEVQEETDEDGNTTRKYVYKLDGEEIELEKVLDSLEALNATGSGEGLTPTRSAEISFLFHRDARTFQEVELTFYQYDSSSCLVSLNGETRLFVSRDSVVSIVEAVNALVLE
ncbi:MAG: DUF4340 domain-containing protein [Oscillospiraceae bacterium]